jgi:nanoRNase/pAp phosphatase (c-di-AMP/oligoRNAs hydrolase)
MDLLCDFGKAGQICYGFGTPKFGLCAGDPAGTAIGYGVSTVEQSMSKYRLVTRSDFDGLVCAVLLKELDMIEEITFVHPKDMQDGKIAIGPNDITTNLPYVPGAHMAFDHHASEVKRLDGATLSNYVIDPNAASAARVVYDHFGGATRFPRISEALMRAVDQADSAQYSVDEILYPEGYTLLNYLMDARTGLGRFRDFRISNYQLMMQLIDAVRDLPIEQVLAQADVAERADLYENHRGPAAVQVRRQAKVHGHLVCLDLRQEETIFATNRFLLYALYPETSISIHVLHGVKQQNTVFAIGKSIINRTSKTHVGNLCLRYGGGGHANAGTCQVANEDAARVLEELIAQISSDGTGK